MVSAGTRRVLRHTGKAVVWVALVAVLCLLVVLVVVPRVAGWVPLTVATGSMGSSVPAGSQVVVEPLHGARGVARVSPGDVVTFLPRPNDPTLVTHRVVRVDRSGAAPRLVTKGDANNVADPWRVGGQQLRGVVRYHVPYAGYLTNLLNRDQKRAGVLAVASLLLLYAGWQVVAAVREGRAGGP